MAVRDDAVGNLIGRMPGDDAAAHARCSARTSTRCATPARYDGPLGVLVAIACVERLRRAGLAAVRGRRLSGSATRRALRFGTAYLGSGARGRAGSTRRALALRDADGVALRDALRGVRRRPGATARRGGRRLLGYVEVHIEQGPVLEARGVPVGVVTAIAGATRAEVRFDGRAPATPARCRWRRGATRSRRRRSSCSRSSGWPRGRRGWWRPSGRLEAEPGARNVIPARRAAPRRPPRRRRRAGGGRGGAAGARRGDRAPRAASTVAWEPRMATPAVAMDPG